MQLASADTVCCAALAVVAAPTALAAPSETVLYSFGGGTDGGFPFGDLIMDSAGNLYGTTLTGGAASGGCGTVFKLTLSGAETVFHSFNCDTDGSDPTSRLTADSAGNLYGTTNFGGASGVGTVYKLTPSGTFSVLYSFSGSPDGAIPEGRLIADSAGNLYGTTLQGGTDCGAGCGTVFSITPNGTGTVLYSFAYTDGAFPHAGLIADNAGNLYGTTGGGGASGNGTVFKLAGTGFPPVLPSTVDQCKENGWQAFGVFKNQGDCVSFVATKGKNQPSATR